MTEQHPTPETTETRDAETLAKRERVRRFLIEPLERDGLVRDRRTSAADHAAFLAKLADRLGYMSPDSLDRLRQVCMAHAGGAARNLWPGWVTIRAFAFRLETPPDPANPIMQSWLHSREGPKLRAQGGLVETYLFLRDNGRQPNEFEVRKIGEDAADAARQRTRVLAAVARGDATDDERRWLAWYDRLTADCNAIVDAGIAHRRAQEAAQ